jgi:molecular chaperone IbpA
MRNYDFTPLYRSTVGFDRLANMLDRALTADVGTNTYPPYNIEKSGDDTYRISVAVAGFSEDELSVEMRDGQLVISAKKAESETPDTVHYLHRGIASRAFEKRFQMADHVRPVGAETKDGLLHIDLVREVPEALKPRRIEIANTANTSQTIDAKQSNKPKKVTKEV